MLTPKLWRLKSGSDRRFRGGHPWVYSNELSESPKGLPPGAPVELRDAAGKFLARGFGNPHSLIAFRSLSRDAANEDPWSPKQVAQKLEQAHRLREALGLTHVSHRLCFGEADGLPGLIIDRYRLLDAEIFVVQAHAAGADVWISEIDGILKSFLDATGSPIPWTKVGIVIRNDLGVRKLEGLESQEPRVLKEAPGVELSHAKILVRSVADSTRAIDFVTDLKEGQKTGFFLDQSGNIALAASRLAHLAKSKKEIRILDLCCYVGQWSTQLSKVFADQGAKVHVTAVDASAKALEFAKRNIETQGAQCEAVKADVLEDLGDLPDGIFDLVISDPPALIQARKDIPKGEHAYLQLNTQAIRVMKPQAALIACSCSALMEEEHLLAALNKATYRNQTQIRWVGRGAQGPDHPMLTEFPEGRYLKCWIGLKV